MMKILSCFPSLAFLFLVGCGLALKENIVGNYYLIAGDEIDGTFLSYHEAKWSDVFGGINYYGIIPSTVFAVGYNDKYMILKQHPRTFPNPPKRNITNYFILPIKKDMNWKTHNGLIGPLTLEAFNKKRKELNIPESVTFTKEIEDLK